MGVYCDLSWLWQMQRQIDLHIGLSGGCFFPKGKEWVCSTWQWGGTPLQSSVSELRGILGQSLASFQPTYMPLSEIEPCHGVFVYWRLQGHCVRQMTF